MNAFFAQWSQRQLFQMNFYLIQRGKVYFGKSQKLIVFPFCPKSIQPWQLATKYQRNCEWISLFDLLARFVKNWLIVFQKSIIQCGPSMMFRHILMYFFIIFVDKYTILSTYPIMVQNDKIVCIFKKYLYFLERHCQSTLQCPHCTYYDWILGRGGILFKQWTSAYHY